MADLIVHRGIISNKHKENLLKSFKQSFKKGHGIETDIHSTKDHKFICFHDFTLNRIFQLQFPRISGIPSLNLKALRKKISCPACTNCTRAYDTYRFNCTYILISGHHLYSKKRKLTQPGIPSRRDLVN